MSAEHLDSPERSLPQQQVLEYLDAIVSFDREAVHAANNKAYSAMINSSRRRPYALADGHTRGVESALSTFLEGRSAPNLKALNTAVTYAAKQTVIDVVRFGEKIETREFPPILDKAATVIDKTRYGHKRATARYGKQDLIGILMTYKSRAASFGITELDDFEGLELKPRINAALDALGYSNYKGIGKIALFFRG